MKIKSGLRAEHVETVTEHNSTSGLDVTEADGTLKWLAVFNYVAVLRRNEGVVVQSFTLQHLAQNATHKQLVLLTVSK